MRTLSYVALLAALLPLAGCPQPANDPSTAAPGAPGEPGAPGGDPGAQGGAPGAPGTPGTPADGTTPPPADGGGASMGDPMERTFASIIGDGPTVTISGTVKGAKVAQVDFTIAKEMDGHKMPELLQVVKVTDGTFSVKAPANYDQPIYISAVSDTNGDGLNPDDPSGCAAEPVKLAGKDVKLEISISADSSWVKKMPWYSADMAPPQPVGAGGAAAPGGAPPAAPGGAAPDGAAPAAPGGAAPGGAAPAAPITP